MKTLIKLTSSLLSLITVIAMGAVAYAEINDIKQQQIIAEYEEQHYCLALNIYHEARGDSILGQRAVGYVTLNRVQHATYPTTICDVVYQAHLDSRGNPVRNQCQFSWYCDGRSDTPRDEIKWESVQQVAHQVLSNYGVKEDFTDGAIMYHAAYVNPYWARDYNRTVRIDTHIFYK